MVTFRLNELESRDQAKAATEKALNTLESFILDFKDKLEQKQVKKLSTEQERAKIDEALTAASSWMESEGYEATEEVCCKSECMFRIEFQ